MQKIRLQFDFSPGALERLDEIKELSHSVSRADTIRAALQLYDYCVRKELEGYKIGLLKDGEKESIPSLIRRFA